MNGNSHCLVALLAMALLSQKERSILYPRWGGIECGATLSDEFRIMWEPEVPKSQYKSLVHRCFVDSTDPKDHGCITRALDHSEGSVSFIRDFMKGDLEGSYNEIEFLENLGMYLGVASHHISDLCTPLHVGHKIDHKEIGFRSKKAFHDKLERDIEKYSKVMNLKVHPPIRISLSRDYFWGIANYTYENHFKRLESVYKKDDEKGLKEMVSDLMGCAVRHTKDVWHTILEKTKMTDRDWSLQPLL